MAAPVLSFRIDDDIVAQLDRLAAATDRDRLYHIKRALTRYLEAESWHVAAIAEGIEDADAGKLTDLEAVQAKWGSSVKDPTDRKGRK
ncbi:CopG family ribbon-helix-helix protein [Pseudomonas solani]|uniref:CopG family ribbon-helix-helix protein n=1 Tax=Pseudomonas solani TaxID=2731552 RepID=UPI003C30ADEE